jgi:hypothetical protein
MTYLHLKKFAWFATNLNDKIDKKITSDINYPMK